MVKSGVRSGFGPVQNGSEIVRFKTDLSNYGLWFMRIWTNLEPFINLSVNGLGQYGPWIVHIFNFFKIQLFSNLIGWTILWWVNRHYEQYFDWLIVFINNILIDLDQLYFYVIRCLVHLWPLILSTNYRRLWHLADGGL